MRVFLAIAAVLALAACGADYTRAPDDVVARARYVHDGPPEIALVTVINNRSEEGAHAALIINASERVIFDPAGTWYHPWAPVQHDVHYGITPLVEQRYIEYHTRITYRTVVQRMTVSPELAETVMQIAKGYGPVNKAFCGDSVSDILRRAGFDVPRTFFPKQIMTAFDKLPGVTSVTHTSGDPDDNKAKLLAQEEEALRAR
ncbi:MAG: hypothetical protein ACK4OP_08100, partial [Gemmobacter sp.]